MGISSEWVWIGCVFSKKNKIFYTIFCSYNWILHFADDLYYVQVLQSTILHSKITCTDESFDANAHFLKSRFYVYYFLFRRNM